MPTAFAASELSSAFTKTRRVLRAAFGRALDLALPPLCPACREPLADPGGLCASCWSRLTFITRPYCERLGIPFAYDPGPGVLSLEAITDPPAYSRARAAVRYEDVSRALIHAFKYGDRLDLAPTLARWTAQAGSELLDGADALIPVPLHRRRLWARRFNQAAMLAERISQSCGVPAQHDVLERVRPTEQQFGLTRAQRAANVQGAFRVSGEGKTAIRGKRLVLIDDVMTSGATADTCARTLLRGGALTVDVLVFARVVAPARSPI
jgi:ComF family protein